MNSYKTKGTCSREILFDIKDNVIKNVDMKKPVIIQPLMIVAGDHAKNDMAGNEDSFYTKVTEAGGKAECVIKGLGEYEAFRKYLIKRTEGMIK